MAFDLVRRLGRLRRCGRDPDPTLDAELRGWMTELGLVRAFNPSFVRQGGVTVLAFRGTLANGDWTASFVCVEDAAGRRCKNISLEHHDEVGGARLIDPKVTALHDGIYVTLHNGWQRGGNQIYLTRVHPDFGPQIRIDYPGRTTQERNWAFYEHGGELRVLYRISPLRILRVTRRTDVAWELTDHKQVEVGVDPTLTIGTPLVGTGRHRYLVAHKKLRVRGKKVYMGRLCRLDLEAIASSPGATGWCSRKPSAKVGGGVLGPPIDVKHGTPSPRLLTSAV